MLGTGSQQLSKNSIDPEWLRDVRVAEYLGVSTMTLWRWDNLPQYAKLKFPKPAIINDLKYRNRAELDAWMRALVVGRVKSSRSDRLKRVRKAS
jgi:predicted DNA-binding transcriptional regulator AlpA